MMYSYEKIRLTTLHLFRMPQDPKMIRWSGAVDSLYFSFTWWFLQQNL